jgi:hypothetical protein
MKNFKYVLFLFALAIPKMAVAQSAKVFYTGNEYLKLAVEYPQIQGVEALYISGLNDAFVIGGQYDWLRECTIYKPQSQLVAIFQNYLNAHPELWDQPASVIYVSAMKLACEKKEQSQP